MDKRFVILILLIFFISVHAYNKPIVVVIPSYNNAQCYERNLDSVCFQQYTNYQIIYIDDCSSDGTAKLVRAYIDKHQLHDKVTLMCNQTHCGAMANHYKAVWMCDDDVIIVHLDGDDWFKHNNVLSRINEVYQDPQVWLTYGQFERYPDGKKGYCRPMPPSIIRHNAFREYDWMTSHVRTFYAGLFKQIKLKDFVYQEGTFFPVTCDMAMFFPLLELAGHHMQCIEDILYVYNEATDANDYKRHLLMQLHCDKLIRSRPKYQQAASYCSVAQAQHIDVILFFTGADCYDLLDVLCASPEITTITLLYTDEQLLASKNIRHYFPEITYRLYTDDLAMIMDELLMRPGYVLCGHDGYTVVSDLSLQQALTALEQTGALSFHFSLGKDVTRTTLLHRQQAIPPLLHCSEGIYAWQYKDAEFDWKKPCAPMSLCRKIDLKRLMQGAAYQTYDEYMQIIQLSLINLDEMGLCFAQAPVWCKRDRN